MPVSATVHSVFAHPDAIQLSSEFRRERPYNRAFEQRHGRTNRLRERSDRCVGGRDRLTSQSREQRKDGCWTGTNHRVPFKRGGEEVPTLLQARVKSPSRSVLGPCSATSRRR